MPDRVAEELEHVQSGVRARAHVIMFLLCDTPVHLLRITYVYVCVLRVVLYSCGSEMLGVQ